MINHQKIVAHKIGSETGRLLHEACCTCGWHAGIWFAADEYVEQSYQRHARAVAEGSTVPWMVGPGSAA